MFALRTFAQRAASRTQVQTLGKAVGPLRILQLQLRPFVSLPSTPIRSWSTIAQQENSQPFEEETLSNYEADQFYPIHIGEVLHGRYLITGKLGYSANSTVWLCRDIQETKYVVVKVHVRTPKQRANREISAYKHLSNITTDNIGCLRIRNVLDVFELVRSNGRRHVCLVHEPLQTTLHDFQRQSGRPVPLPSGLAKPITRCLLEALDFLHTVANITHCDIKLSNIMMQIEDTSVLDDFENTERTDPCIRKVVDEERTIYQSRSFRHPRENAFGSPVLCDFGEARIGGAYPYEEIHPEVYKAPEILMQIDWGHSADIWMTACMIWDMIEVQYLFDGYDNENLHNNRVHIGEMVGFLGHPPVEFQKRSQNSWRVFNENGEWKGNPPLSPQTLEGLERRLQGSEKTAFLAFIRSMLQWVPEARPTAAQLLEDPWLKDEGTN
ncbi:protein kinase [Cucurbitaria berberidis CBS 394.84]|uniref:non-specific serine/threonine protein kinase n=1 Tax=Cucurbitaria berberidis CBS 394.84 TaxID=1168544 RepID=A0A9P4GBG1_9PLEO|nr:protein kinase [Cucurbitaria berberidis CBS 394.84]KAF1842367.1 protein kinase [Cucurbitaria berberidis CBS 394.84]